MVFIFLLLFTISIFAQEYDDFDDIFDKKDALLGKMKEFGYVLDDELTTAGSTGPPTEPPWVGELRNKLKIAYMDKTDDTPSKIHELYKEADDRINRGITEETLVEESDEDEHTYNSYLAHKTDKKLKSNPNDPQWIKEFKNYLHNTMTVYGRKSLEEQAAPMIKLVQENNNAVIKKIDVDPYGNIDVDFVTQTTEKVEEDFHEKIKGYGPTDLPKMTSQEDS